VQCSRTTPPRTLSITAYQNRPHHGMLSATKPKHRKSSIFGSGSGRRPPGITDLHLSALTDSSDPERLFTIDSELRKRIGSEPSLILSQFIDIMKEIAPRFPVHAVRKMFDELDTANDGVIPSSFLIHGMFLPRLIMMFQERGDGARSLRADRPDSVAGSAASKKSARSLLATDCEVTEVTDREALERLGRPELVRKLQAKNEEILRLRRWIIEIGQPAEQKVARLEEEMEVYRSEMAENMDEMGAMANRLSVAERELTFHQTARSHSQQRIDSLLRDIKRFSLTKASERETEELKDHEAAGRTERSQPTGGRIGRRNEALTERVKLLGPRRSALSEATASRASEKGSPPVDSLSDTKSPELVDLEVLTANFTLDATPEMPLGQRSLADLSFNEFTLFRDCGSRSATASVLCGADVVSVADSVEKMHDDIGKYLEEIEECSYSVLHQRGLRTLCSQIKGTLAELKERERYRLERLREDFRGKIKALTKEIYGLHFKKHSSYKSICGEMLRNAGGHTVDVIKDSVMNLLQRIIN